MRVHARIGWRGKGAAQRADCRRQGTNGDAESDTAVQEVSEERDRTTE